MPGAVISDWPEEDGDPPEWRLATSKGPFQRLTREIGVRTSVQKLDGGCMDCVADSW